MGSIGRLFAEIVADNSGFSSGINNAVRVAEDGTVKLTGAGRKLATQFEAALNPTTKLAQQIQALELAGKKASDIALMYGSSLQKATREAIAHGQAVDPIVKKYADMAAAGQSSASKIAAAFGKIGAGLGLYFGATTFASIGKESIKMAMDAVESENLFSVSMGKMADSARAWSKEVSAALGLNQYELRKTIGTFNVMFTAMGFGAEKAYEMASGLTTLAQDFASFYNLRPEEAFQKLQSGIAGEVEPLRRLGILVDENTTKTYAYKTGIAKMGEELSQQQKVLARYGVIMEQTKAAQGDLARTMESPANAVRRLNANWQELQVTIGQLFLPLMNPLVNHLTQVVDRMNMLSDKMPKFWQSLPKWLGGVESGVDMEGLIAEQRKLWEKLNKDTVPKTEETIAGVTEEVKKQKIEVDNVHESWVKILNTLYEMPLADKGLQIQIEAKKISQALHDALGDKDFGLPGARSILGTQYEYDPITNTFKTKGTISTDYLKDLGIKPGLMDQAKSKYADLGQHISTIQDSIREGWQQIGDAITRVDYLSGGLKGLWQGLEQSFKNMVNSMIGSWVRGLLQPMLNYAAGTFGSLFGGSGWTRAVATKGATESYGSSGSWYANGFPSAAYSRSGRSGSGWPSGLSSMFRGPAGVMGGVTSLASPIGMMGMLSGNPAAMWGGLAGAGLFGGAGAIGGLGMSGILAAGVGGAGIGAAVALAASLIYKALSKDAFKSGSAESMRDFGVSISSGTIQSFLSDKGISKSIYEGIRKDITSSPEWLTKFAYPAAQQQGATDAFLRSLEAVETAWGTFNFRSAFETWIKTGNAKALNQAFIDAFSQSQRLTSGIPNWQSLLLSGETATSGSTTTAGRVRLNYRPITSTALPISPRDAASASTGAPTVIVYAIGDEHIRKITRDVIIPTMVSAAETNDPVPGRSKGAKVLLREAIQ